ncbi:C13 family peptidase [Steroidobacter sp.]|uniref:C13 family peptidase n=1 Tax=Steroidobacter sp. TaxID=1978227 RepID=UPI001A3F3635|nr:C13 family peptidase [Steroidobacter sp.]MBL8270759.1 caspase family protein [Steroidobacter sp.]
MLPESATPPETSAHEVASTGSSFGQWLRAALRFVTLRRVDGAALTGGFVSIAAPALLALAIWAGADWLNNAPDPDFYPYGAPALAWFVLAALVVAMIFAVRSRPAISIAKVCSLLALLAPILVAAQFAIERYIPERWTDWAYAVVAAYAVIYCAAGLRSLTGQRQLIALLGGATVAFLAIWLGGVLYVSPALWAPAGSLDEDYAGEGDWGAYEALLFEQAARIDAAVDRLTRPADAASVNFFVGFAGFGDQKVFAEEIKFAAERIAERYDTSARTLLLVNDRRDLNEQPLASAAALSYALKGVATKMDLDRDILFLALSSHGSEDPLLSVTNGSIPFRNLTGGLLAQALNESGIKWRVIVISACHAGAFIEPLKDEHTIVITAAAADKTSFGCSDDRDLTYFGEAFYRDALPQAKSLREAFDTAKALIAEREQEEGVDASYPQAYFGEQLEQRLAEKAKAGS